MPTLSEEVRREVARARALLHPALDGLADELRRASGRVTPTAKDDGTPVTALDHEVDDRLRTVLERELPDHGVLSEEHDTVVPDTEWCWVVDPIDGTSNFTAGLPWWCVSVALTHGGEVVYATIDAPALGRRYEAVRGEGATRDGETVRVRGPVAWDDASQGHVPVMLTTGTARRARGAGLALNPRVMGSTALDLAVVAEGVAAASVAAIPHVWDVAAGMLLVREAGGAVVTLDGDELLPLRAGDDHARMHAQTAAGADPDAVRALARRLLPD
ncbi:inositol monophosphatase family protein [Egicoccus halophilus]|uniref:inositol-phosphate phosphatase n=1 Tax=Egicoccus halophilus TaxID=1670830 RepID=A0A8J3A9U7_9ACTN|nr:inositol monophosphatase [Egicoccus halophilus]GGI07922.1 inositol-phosphate phosphatase [Egicoccus halophilus]